jgi:hypothetical protein
MNKATIEGTVFTSSNTPIKNVDEFKYQELGRLVGNKDTMMTGQL